IRTYKTDQSTYQLSVSDLPQGMYFVRVIKGGKTSTQKLIKK
ncbi:MAG TPA: T9SS type A sorting domain-containing protein, partial [Petrimonas sp.]|nr:T9SS type A sorting domain-containing protein [Petrimonas sp.]